MESKRYFLLLFVTVMMYYAASKYIFDKVYETINIVIDERFHIPQGKAYCEGNFLDWDPKITTPPGLYIVSTLFLWLSQIKDPCNIYMLRFCNLIASVINLLLFSSMLKYIYGNSKESSFKIVLQALNLAILPPLYFFSHVYYTDIMSLTFLLIFSRLNFGYPPIYCGFLMLFTGFADLCMRQTNAIWIALIFGHKFLDVFIKSSRVHGNQYLNRKVLRQNSIIAHLVDNTKLKRYYGLYDLYIALKYHLRSTFISFYKYLTLSDCFIFLIHISLLLMFISFVIWNGGVVLGDKESHKPTLHLAQIVYFLIFYAVFGLPYVLAKFKSTLLLIYRNIFLAFALTIPAAICVYYKEVHPYLLADNRHYTFYIFNRLFLKYPDIDYYLIPAYIFLLFSLYDNLRCQNCITFFLPYCISILLVLVPQKLVEVRYFLVPFIILKLRFSRPSFKIVVFEFLWYLMINAATFHVFFTKEVHWEDEEVKQRIIW